MKIFQNKIFILILIISVISVSLPEIVQAGPAVGLLIGFLVNVLVMDILVITTIGIVGDIIFIASLFCTFGGPIGDCDEAEGGGVFIAVMPQDINCAFVQGVTFYNTLPHDRENDSTRQIKIYRFTKPTSISSERLAYWLTKSWPFTNDSVPLLIGKGITLEKGSGRVVAEAMKSLRTGGYLDVSAYYRSGAVPAAYATVNYSDICDDSGVCTFNDILPEKSYVAYVAKVMGAYDLLSPAYFYNETAPSFPDAIGLGYGDDGLYGCDSSRSAFVVPSLGDPLWDWWNDLTWRQKGLRGPFAKDDTFNADSYQLVTWKCDNKFLSSKEGKYPYRMSRTYSKVPPIINVYKTGSLDSCGEDGDEDGDLANVAIIGTDCDSITLSINPLSSDVTKYDIERDGVLIAQSVPISQTTYQDTGLTGGVTYSYNITVRTDSGIFQDRSEEHTSELQSH